MGYGPPTKTFADVQRAVQRQFGDESGVQLEDPDIAGWVNDAQVTINSLNKVLRASGSLPSVAGQGAYSLATIDPPIQQIESLHYNGMRIPNMTFAQAEETVSQSDPNGEMSSDSPTLWYEWGGSVTFWPKPESIQTIMVFYTAMPTPITASPGDLLSLPDDYFQDIVAYVLKQAYEMDEDWEASNAKAQQLDASLVERGERERTAQNMTFETITVVNDYY